MLVTDGIHLVDGIKGANVYLVTGPQLFLVDTGLPGQEKRICKYLKTIGIAPSELQGIVLTHYDVDHVGSVAALQKLSNCPVYAHPAEIPYILGQKKRPGIKRWLPLLICPIYGKLATPSNVHPLSDNEQFADWEIIYTPGHTPGHICLYRNGIAIVGDLLQGGQIRLAPGFFTLSSQELKISVQNLIERPLRWILPGHGPATAASSHWLDNLQRKLRTL